MLLTCVPEVVRVSPKQGLNFCVQSLSQHSQGECSWGQRHTMVGLADRNIGEP